MERQFHEIPLEPSTHTHTLKSTGKMEVKDQTDGTVIINTNGNSFVTHGEHRTIGFESTKIVKYTQQEYNPVTGVFQPVFD